MAKNARFLIPSPPDAGPRLGNRLLGCCFRTRFLTGTGLTSLPGTNLLPTWGRGTRSTTSVSCCGNQAQGRLRLLARGRGFSTRLLRRGVRGGRSRVGLPRAGDDRRSRLLPCRRPSHCPMSCRAEPEGSSLMATRNHHRGGAARLFASGRDRSSGACERSMYASPHSCMASTMPSRVRPKSVSEYSTLGGTSA